MTHLKPELSTPNPDSRLPSPIHIDSVKRNRSTRHSSNRSSSELGFADAVTDLVDIVKYETSRKGRARRKLIKISIFIIKLI